MTSRIHREGRGAARPALPFAASAQPAPGWPGLKRGCFRPEGAA